MDDEYLENKKQQVNEQKQRQKERLSIRKRWVQDKRCLIGNQVRETGGQGAGDWQKEQLDLLQTKRDGI